MARQKQKNSLSQRELDVMKILWKSDSSLIASEIVSSNPALTINTVQSVLRNLLKKGFVKINDIVYSGTVLSRSYSPTISVEDFSLYTLTNNFKEVESNISKSALIAALLNEEKNKKKALEEIEQLQIMLENYKKNL